MTNSNQLGIKSQERISSPVNIILYVKLQPLLIRFFLTAIHEWNRLIHSESPNGEGFVRITESFKFSSILAVFIMISREVHPHGCFGKSTFIIIDDGIQLLNSCFS